MIKGDEDAVMVSIASPDAVVIATNPAYATWLGRDLENVVGHSCQEWNDPATWDHTWVNFQRAVATGQVVDCERRIIRPDGRVVPSRLSARPLIMKGGRSIVLCTNYVMPKAGLTRNSDAVRQALEVASYVKLLSGELSEMAGHRGLLELAEGLDQVVAEAAQAEERLSRPLM